jgi:fucose 4-O-acetylase-like acetyltransferase
MEKVRILYFDLIKSFAIFLVVWGHVLQYGYSYTSNDDFFFNKPFSFIYSFHMPLFMILCGFFSSSCLKQSFVQLVKSKFKTLFLPGVMWIFLLYVVCVIYCLYFNTNLLGLLDKFPNPLNMFWFINCLIACYIVFFISMKLIKSDYLAFIITCIIAFLVPYGYFDNFNFMLPYFWIGYFLKKYYFYFEIHVNMIFISCLLIYFVLLLFWTGWYSVYKYPIHYYYGISLNYIGVIFYRYSIGFFGSIFFIGLFYKICKNIKNYHIPKFAICCGQYTLVIYIFNISLTFAYCVFFDRNIYSFHSNLNVFYYIYAPIVSLIVLLVAVLIIRICERNKNLRLLFLGKKQ